MTLRIFRRELDVGDERVLGIIRIDLAGRNAGDVLVLPDASEGMATEGCSSGQDLYLRDARMRVGHGGQDADRREARRAEPGQFCQSEFRIGDTCSRAACGVKHRDLPTVVIRPSDAARATDRERLSE